MLNLSRLFSSWTASTSYKSMLTLVGHTAAVNDIKANSTATLLATGGDDEEIRTWNLRTGKCVQVIRDSMMCWGQITTLDFIDLERSGLSKDVLCFGTGHGQFLMYHCDRSEIYVELRQLGVFKSGDFVECFAFDHYFRNFIIASHHGQLKLFKFERKEFTLIWSCEHANMIPRSIYFANRGTMICLAMLYSGEIICRDVETSIVKFTRQLRTPIGNVDICSTTSNMVVDNLTTGMDLYSQDDRNSKMLFSIPSNSKLRVIKSAVFAEAGKAIVGGSDHGNAYVFEVASGNLRETLIHGDKEQLIQAVGVTSTREDHFVITSASNKSYDLRLWKKKIVRKRVAERRATKSQMTPGVAEYLVIVIVLWWFKDFWFLPLKNHYEIAVVPRVQPVLAEYAQALESMWATPSIPVEEPVRTPSLVDLVNSLDEETVKRLWGQDTPFSESALLHVAKQGKKPATKETGLVIVA